MKRALSEFEEKRFDYLVTKAKELNERRRALDSTLIQIAKESNNIYSQMQKLNEKRSKIIRGAK